MILGEPQLDCISKWITRSEPMSIIYNNVLEEPIEIKQRIISFVWSSIIHSPFLLYPFRTFILFTHFCVKQSMKSHFYPSDDTVYSKKFAHISTYITTTPAWDQRNVSLHSWSFQLAAQSAATCSRWFLTRRSFYPEDVGDIILRNVGSHKNYTAPHPRKRLSSIR
jgi:hypothetical protein